MLRLMQALVLGLGIGALGIVFHLVTAPPGQPASGNAALQWFLIVLVLVACGWIVARGWRRQRLLRRARQAIEAGNFSEARASYLRLLHEPESHFRPEVLLFGLAYVELQSGDGSEEQALAILERCASYGPALELRMLIAIHRRDWKSACALARQRSARSRQTPWTILLMVCAALGNGEFELAERWLESAEKRFRRSSTLRSIRARMPESEALRQLILDTSTE